ncbi:hypothetical protein BSKO_13959 [Bryopsis sp. KO-2023]|nr:hypothetical protein BSKO_13959 [Bryopsis sp. KO-2023]
MAGSTPEVDASKSPAKVDLDSANRGQVNNRPLAAAVKEEEKESDAPPPPPSAEIKSLYRIMQRREKSLGGGEGLVGVYGTITLTGMRLIFHALTTKCDFSHESSLVDIGAGLGRPLLHALVDPGISGAWGIELDSIKCQKAETFIERAIEDCTSQDIPVLPGTTPKITCSSIEEIQTLDPYTHAYSFWEGVPQTGKNAFGRLFRKSETMKGVAVVQKAFRKDPALEMRKMGFGPLALLDSIRVSMSGSGRKFMAYMFRKSEQSPVSPLPIIPAAISSPKDTREKKNKEAGEEWAAEIKAEHPVSKGTRLSWAKRRDIRALKDEGEKVEEGKEDREDG